MKRGYFVTSAEGRAARWLLSVIIAALLIALYSVVLAAVRPQIVLAATSVEVSFTTPASRPYDGMTEAQIVGCNVVTDTYPDELTCAAASGAAAEFADKNVGLDKTVTALPADFVLSGDNAENYQIDTVQATTADITQRDLTPDATGVNKVYDGGTDAMVTFSDDRIAGDAITYTYDADFADKNVGTGKSISVTNITISGEDSGNYQLTTTTDSTTADITQRDLTPTPHGVNRGYDGTSVASVTFTDDRVAGDAFVYAFSAVFDDRNAGNGKPISVTDIAISGGDSGNYQLTTTAGSTSADVAQEALTVTANPNTKVADGTTSAAATPSVTSGTIFFDDTANFIETYDTAAAGTGKTLTPSGEVIDGNNGDNYSYTFVPVNTGQIRPAPAASISFITQPIDTKTNTPIYSVCVPSGGTAPCALAGASGSTPIKVEARDAFGNLAGPGAPGADGTTTAVQIRIRRDTIAGTTLGTASTANGVAAFDDQLVINDFPLPVNNKLHATAISGQTGTPTALSDQYDIVTDLFACDDQTCNNNGNNNAGNKLQKTAGQIKTTGDFFSGTTNVLLTTRFTSGDDTNQAACGFNASTGRNKTIGQAIDLQVVGTGVEDTTPSTAMVLIMPKNTLKAFGITARGTDTFNICLGAKKIASGPAHWTGKHPTNKNGGLVPSQSGSEDREWGVPANCGTTGLSPEDPCIGLRTKQAAALRSYLSSLGWTTAQINALGMSDADFAIVLRKGSPWDGKGGLY